MKNLFSRYKHLFAVSFAGFIFLYSSTFIKGYGYFIDEFYYVACANHPAFGYVDHPPLAPFILLLFKSVFGESIYLLRIIPAFAFAGTVYFTGILAKQMGGNKFAQTFASVLFLIAPVFPIFSAFYSMNAFEPLLCAAAIYFILKIINEDKPEYWIHTGVIFGLLLMNKHTAGLFIVFIVISLLITKERKYLFTKQFLYSAIITIVILSPNIIWQIQNGFPSLEFYKTVMLEKNSPLPPIEFIKMQLLGYNIFSFPIIIAGLYLLIFDKRYKSYRPLAFLFIFTFLFFLLTKAARPDRTEFAYIGVFASGAIYAENIIQRFKHKWFFAVYGILMTAFFCFVMPLFIPFLSYGNTEYLFKLSGINSEIEKGNKPLILQTLSDKIGWQERVDMAGKIYQSLSENEKNRTIIAADNYGMAGALELLGKKYGMKNIVSSHNNYYLWSKSRLKGDIVIRVTRKDNYEDLKESFEKVDTTDSYYDNPYCSMHERNMTVFICRYPKYTYEEMLEKGKHFY